MKSVCVCESKRGKLHQSSTATKDTFYDGVQNWLRCTWKIMESVGACFHEASIVLVSDAIQFAVVVAVQRTANAVFLMCTDTFSLRDGSRKKLIACNEWRNDRRHWLKINADLGCHILQVYIFQLLLLVLFTRKLPLFISVRIAW